MKKKIEVKKCNEMIYAILIDNEVYCYTGTESNANKIKKSLDFIYNI